MALSSSFATFFPQFCSDPINDSAWYPGFNDWDLVREVPAAMRDRFTPAHGYYDLSRDEAISEEFRIFSRSRWSGIALYHYYFDGRHALDGVERFMIAAKSAVPPFFAIWANETWTKRWVGRPREIIIEQRHSVAAPIVAKHVERLSQLMQSASYVRVRGRPIFVIYAPYEIKNVGGFLNEYRKAFQKEGLDPLIGFCVSYVDPQLAAKHFDFCLEFQPRLFFNTMRASRHVASSKYGLLMKRASPRLYEQLTNIRDSVYRNRDNPRQYFSYRDYLALAKNGAFTSVLRDSFGIPVVPSTFFSWNNFPRYRGSAIAVSHESSDQEAFFQLCAQMSSSEEWYMVNSWNEWSEGAALEPGVLPLERYDLTKYRSF